GLHPFVALRSIFNEPEYTPPGLLDLPPGLRYWPLGWYLSNPASFYTTFMFALSFLLVTPSIVLLRKLAQSTTSIKTLVLQRLHIVKGDRTRKPRYVWSNPIAWREAKTKASAARASLLRYGFMSAGVIGAIVLVYLYSSKEPVAKFIDADSYNPQYQILTVRYPDGRASDVYTIDQATMITINGNANARPENLNRPLALTLTSTMKKTLTATSINAWDIPRRLNMNSAQKFLLGLAIVEVAVILLIVTNAAASTVTREKEDGSLDLLLTTPITSRYYIWGKLRGLVSYVLPLVAVPVVSAMIFIFHDMLRFAAGSDRNSQWIVFPEAMIILPGLLIIVAAFASIL